jgi:hypothetical protein
MKINDLSGVPNEETPATLIAPGIYEVLVTNAEEGQASTGTPSVELDLEIMSSGDWKGRTQKDWIYITERALWRVRMVLDALQIEVPEGEFDLQPAQLVNRRCEITIDHETYEGKIKARVKRYERVSGEAAVAAPAPTDNSDLPF